MRVAGATNRLQRRFGETKRIKASLLVANNRHWRINLRAVRVAAQIFNRHYGYSSFFSVVEDTTPWKCRQMRAAAGGRGGTRGSTG